MVEHILHFNVYTEVLELAGFFPDPNIGEWVGFMAFMGFLVGGSMILFGIYLLRHSPRRAEWLMSRGAVVIMLSFFLPAVFHGNWRGLLTIVVVLALTHWIYHLLKRRRK